jgi:hypothetical protein
VHLVLLTGAPGPADVEFMTELEPPAKPRGNAGYLLAYGHPAAILTLLATSHSSRTTPQLTAREITKQTTSADPGGACSSANARRGQLTTTSAICWPR